MSAPTQGLRYMLVAGVCLVSHNVIMIVVDRLGAAPLVGIVTSFCLVAVIGYRLHSRYTFLAPRSLKGFSRYTLAMVPNLPLSFVLIWLFATVLGWPMVFASPTASGCLIAMNFVTSRWAILGSARRGVATP